MKDLIAFLLERIAVDEAWLTPPTARRMIGGKMADVPIERLPSYVERDRKRWAAECEAKRRIVNSFAASSESLTARTAEMAVVRMVLKLLALPYVGHPDYREEWRP